MRKAYTGQLPPVTPRAYPNHVEPPASSGLGTPPARLLNVPVYYNRLRELRAGIGVSNADTGSFQFFGKWDSCACSEGGIAEYTILLQVPPPISALPSACTSASNKERTSLLQALRPLPSQMAWENGVSRGSCSL